MAAADCQGLVRLKVHWLAHPVLGIELHHWTPRLHGYLVFDSCWQVVKSLVDFERTLLYSKKTDVTVATAVWLTSDAIPPIVLLL